MKLSVFSCVALVAAVGFAEEEIVAPAAAAPATVVDASSCAKFVAPVETQLKAKQTECNSLASQHDANTKQLSDSLKNSQQQATVCQTKVSEFDVLTKKLQAELKAVEATEQKLKEMEGVRAELEAAKKANAEIGNLKQSNANLNTQIATVTKSFDEAKVSHAAAIEELTQLRSKGNDLESCERSRASSEAELVNMKAANTRVLAEKNQQLSALSVESAQCKKELADSTEKIYTASQFWQSFEHSKHVGSAFLLFSRNRVVKLVGPETYELAKLQMQLWYSKAAKRASAVYRPMKIKAVEVYDAHLKSYVATAMEKAALFAEAPLQVIQDRFNSALVGVERYMERVITNLSDSTPTVREVFPENFHDRCFAFAFISLIVFTLSTVMQWVFSTFVSTPLSWVFGYSKAVEKDVVKKPKAASTKKKNVSSAKTTKVAGK